jgi:hypothetical protein
MRNSLLLTLLLCACAETPKPPPAAPKPPEPAVEYPAPISSREWVLTRAGFYLNRNTKKEADVVRYTALFDNRPVLKHLADDCGRTGCKLSQQLIDHFPLFIVHAGIVTCHAGRNVADIGEFKELSGEPIRRKHITAMTLVAESLCP